MAGKVIVTCALTGSGHTPSMSSSLPYAVGDIIGQGVAAAEAGPPTRPGPAAASTRRKATCASCPASPGAPR